MILSKIGWPISEVEIQVEASCTGLECPKGGVSLPPSQCLILGQEVPQTSFQIQAFDGAHFPEWGPGLLFQLQNMNQNHS